MGIDHRSNQPISERIYHIGMEYADALAAAQLLEDGKSAFVAQRMSQIDGAVAKAERDVKASSEYSDYIKRMVKARQHANRIKAQLEYLRAKLTEWQSEQANQRLQARV